MFEAASTTIKRKIDNRDYAEAMDLIEKLRGTLDDSKIGDEAKELYQHKSICHELSGDCHFGMDKLERSLREYEQALNWITKVYSPTEYPCMSVLFKIERLLSHMYTQQEKGLQYEKRWQAGLLMQAEDWLESGMYQMPVIQSETNDHLEKLWHQEVKKQKKAKKKQQDSQGKETRSLADFMDTLYKVLRANQGPLIIITTILLFVSGYQIILNSGKLYEELQGDYTSSSSDGTDPTAKKNRKKKKTKLVVANGNSFSYAGQKEQLLFHARQALVTIGDKVYAVPYRTDPTTVPDFLSLTMTSTLSRCLWLRRTDFGLQLPSGTVLFDRKCPEYKLSNALSTLLSEWSKTPETAA
ncbi:MAG: hypothetical protein K2Z81_04685, partial [Cyanobacteria bacterium]|nr:hypothetical protein [Cyanobacteriota bacterium]